MIIQIKDGKYQSYEVDVKFETRIIKDHTIEEYGDQKITSDTSYIKIVGWSYDTSDLSEKQQAEVEHHLKEYLMDIEGLLN